MCSLSWYIILMYRYKVGLHDKVQTLQCLRCPAYDILILFGTRNNFTFSGALALFVKGCVVLQWPLCLWTQMATNDLYLLYWEPAWNNLYRPEFLLWRTALWKCLVLDTFQHVPSGARDTIAPSQLRCRGAGLGRSLSALRGASEQMQSSCCGTRATLFGARVNLQEPG